MSPCRHGVTLEGDKGGPGGPGGPGGGLRGALRGSPPTHRTAGPGPTAVPGTAAPSRAGLGEGCTSRPPALLWRCWQTRAGRLPLHTGPVRDGGGGGRPGLDGVDLLRPRQPGGQNQWDPRPGPLRGAGGAGLLLPGKPECRASLSESSIMIKPSHPSSLSIVNPELHSGWQTPVVLSSWGNLKTDCTGTWRAKLDAGWVAPPLLDQPEPLTLLLPNFSLGEGEQNNQPLLFAFLCFL